MRFASGSPVRMDFAMSFSSVVLPAFGGETIIPLCPLPIGLMRSTIRVAREPSGRSSRIRSSGKIGVMCSNTARFLASSAGRPLTEDT